MPLSLTADALVDHWMLAPGHAGHGLAERSQRIYRSIFSAFCLFLAPRHWSEAAMADVVAYCTGARPKTKAHSPSPATVNRYYRVLAGFLQAGESLACQHGESWTSPLRHQPMPPEIHRRADVASTVLNTSHLQSLRAQCRRQGDWLQARNTAMLAMLLDTAMTRGELESLQQADVADGSVRVQGPRPAQRRVLPIGARCRQLLLHYLQQRPDGLAEPALFINERGQRASSQAFFNAISCAIDGALGLHGDKAAHHGPNVLRNAVLRSWLEAGMPAAEVAALAGLQREQSLSRLLQT